MVEEIIRAGILAPSAKNRQPWKFVVAAEGAKEGMLAALAAGLEREKREPFLPESACYLDGVPSQRRENFSQINPPAPDSYQRSLHSTASRISFLGLACGASAA